MNDKMRGSLYGLFVADALAAPYEYRNQEYMERLSSIEMIPPHGHQRTYKDASLGSWSDEGALTLMMMDTIVNCHNFKPKHYLKNVMTYKEEGAFTATQHAFGYSRHLEQVLKAYQEGGKIYHLDEVAKSRDTDSLVRSLPLALWDLKNDAKSTIQLAHKQALVTNGNPVVGVCSAIYMQWIKNILNKVNNPFVKAVHQLFELYNAEMRQIIVEEILQHQPKVGVNDVAEVLMDTYEIICKTDSFHSAVTEAVRRGNHTTALSSSVGSIAGLIYGYRNIPAKWTEALRQKEMIDQHVEAFNKELKENKEK